jgi:CheY-like chemotaxis protein
MKFKVLFVDDDGNDFYFTSRAFDGLKSHLQLVQVYNGAKALQYLHELEIHQYPDLIILDMNMPVMDGKAALMELKKSNALRLIPVILLSSKPTAEDVSFADSHGVGLQTKPATYPEYSAFAEGILKRLTWLHDEKRNGTSV